MKKNIIKKITLYFMVFLQININSAAFKTFVSLANTFMPLKNKIINIAAAWLATDTISKIAFESKKQSAEFDLDKSRLAVIEKHLNQKHTHEMYELEIKKSDLQTIQSFIYGVIGLGFCFFLSDLYNKTIEKINLSKLKNTETEEKPETETSNKL
jgi:hypothetical protein